MRLPDDIRKCVAFIGLLDESDNFTPGGTVFLIAYQNTRYLITAKHVAVATAHKPFAIRFNAQLVPSMLIKVNPQVDGIRWFTHSDEGVDIALMPFQYDLRGVGLDALVLEEAFVVGGDKIRANDVGIGSFCYTVGLFRLVAGKSRNLPVVHFGSIALMPENEEIPIRDKISGEARSVRAYLVETHGLDGLSGSPVFVRPALTVTDIPWAESKLTVQAPRGEIFLLGVWSASWTASPDQVLATERGKDVRVSVGMGVVVPTDRILEILTGDEELVRLRNLKRQNI